MLAILFDSEVTGDRWIVYPAIPLLRQPMSFGVSRRNVRVLRREPPWLPFDAEVTRDRHAAHLAAVRDPGFHPY